MPDMLTIGKYCLRLYGDGSERTQFDYDFKLSFQSKGKMWQGRKGTCEFIILGAVALEEMQIHLDNHLIDLLYSGFLYGGGAVRHLPFNNRNDRSSLQSVQELKNG